LKKNILIISSDYKPRDGGIAEFAYRIANQLDNSGVGVHVIAPESKGALEYDSLSNRISVCRIDGLFDVAGLSIKSVLSSPYYAIKNFVKFLEQYRLVKNYCEKNKIDKIVCFQWNPLALVACLLHVLVAIEYSIVVHGAEVIALGKTTTSVLQNGIRWLLQRLAFLKSNLVFASSEYTKNLVLDNVSSCLPICVTYCGVDVKQFYPATKDLEIIAKHGLSGKVVLLTIARLVVRKGIDNVLLSLNQYIKKFGAKKVVYLIAGKGPDENRLRCLVAKLGLEKNVKFLGYVPEEDKNKLYNIADAFIMVSRRGPGNDIEGFGIVYLEANSAGLPVVAGESGGVPSAVRDNVNGVLVNPLDLEKIAKAIEVIVHNEGFRKALGVSGREFVKKRFTWEMVSSGFIKWVFSDQATGKVF